MYTINVALIDKDNLREISDKEFSVINFNSKTLLKNLAFCNLNREDLRGKYYDKEGNVVYKVDSELFMFDLKIKELKNLF